MIYLVIAVSLLPLVTYIVVGLSKQSRASTLDEYFVYNQRVTARDYANTSVGYALQMAAVFLFAYWGILYGIGAFWTPVAWFLGFLLLYKLLPRFVNYHQRPRTMHEYLAERYGAGRNLQALAATATIIGLWGTMMLEIDYTVQLYSPVFSTERQLFSVGAVFLVFGVSYIIANGYKAEVNTERFQVPLAYAGFTGVLLLTIPRVWHNAGPTAYAVVSGCLAFTFLAMLAAKLQLDWRHPFGDVQVAIPALGLIGLCVVTRWVVLHASAGSALTVMDQPVVGHQLKAQGYLALFSLFVANAMWMPVDLSTWQRIASVQGSGEELLKRLRKGTFRVMIESPASWCLGVVLGLIINAGGFLPSNVDASQGLAYFSTALSNGTAMPFLPWSGKWLYLIFLAACISIMLSTVDSIISAIAFTAHRDLPPYRGAGKLGWARLWTVAIMLAGMAIYPFLRIKAGANLPTLLYAAYSSQLSLLIIVLLALFNKNLEKRAAVRSILGGFAGTVISALFALSIPSPDAAVLPPIFAVAGAGIGYVLGFKRRTGPALADRRTSAQ